MPEPDGATLAVATGEGRTATVTIRYVTSRTIEIVLTPPEPETVAALGTRLRSPPDEAIYGLTERMRDRPLVPFDSRSTTTAARGRRARSAGRAGRDVHPADVLPLCAVLPDVARLRAAVGGTTPGVFDVAHDGEGRDGSRFRFETGTTPESRRLALHLFAGPEHATILDEYTALTGRPFVPPTGRSCTGAGAASSRTVRPRCSTALVNAELAEDVLMYETLGIPPGVYLFDRPVLAGNFGFARWEWDETRLPNLAPMLGRCGAAATAPDVERLLGVRQRSGRQRHRGAGARLHRARTRRTAALRRHRRRRASSSTSTTPTRAPGGATRSRAFMARRHPGIKLDRGEEHIPSAVTDVWADGRTGREVRNDYPRLQAHAPRCARARRFPTATSCSSRAPATPGRRGGRSSGAATSPAAELRRRARHRSRPAQRDHQPAARGVHRRSHLGLGYGRLLRVQGPRGVRALARVQRLLRNHGDRRRRGARAVGHADRAALRRGDDRHLPALHAAARDAAAVHRRRGARTARRGMPIVRPMPFFERARPRGSPSSGTSTCSAPTCWWRRSGGRAADAARSTCRAARGAATGTGRGAPRDARRSPSTSRSTRSRCSCATAGKSRDRSAAAVASLSSCTLAAPGVPAPTCPSSPPASIRAPRRTGRTYRHAGAGRVARRAARARARRAAARSTSTRHLERGKLMARERIELLLDRDSPFLELVAARRPGAPSSRSAASVVTGIGVVSRRRVRASPPTSRR